MKLLAIDGNSIINRAFYGIKLLTTKDGRYTNAVYGFINILNKLSDSEKPDGIAVAFDLKAPTFRHKKYAEYKAGRKGMPDELASQLPVMKEWLRLAGCVCVECEGYETDDVIYGLKAMIKTVGAEKGIIVIEDNKQDAIELMEDKTAGCENIEVVAAKTKYPQGAEKMLIKRVLKRQVPSGGLPADVGCVVANVSTTKAISDAIQKGMPLIERVVTMTGERLKNPGNYIVKIGTSTKELIDYCGGITGDDVTIKAGGPMMGFDLSDPDVPIMKGSNGIIAVDTDHTAEQPCIKCGRCVDVCPMELSPLYFSKYADEENWQGMKEKNVMDCIECRSCEYICSSKIPLVTKIKAGKNAVRGMK